MAIWQRFKTGLQSFAGPAAENPEREQWRADYQEARAIARYLTATAVGRRPAGRWWSVSRTHD